MQLHTVYFKCKLLYMFRVVSPPIIRSTNNCIYSNGCLVPDAVDTVICAPDDGWRTHPKHVEQFRDKINCIIASCWTFIDTVNLRKYIQRFLNICTTCLDIRTDLEQFFKIPAVPQRFVNVRTVVQQLCFQTRTIQQRFMGHTCRSAEIF